MDLDAYAMYSKWKSLSGGIRNSSRLCSVMQLQAGGSVHLYSGWKEGVWPGQRRRLVKYSLCKRERESDGGD